MRKLLALTLILPTLALAQAAIFFAVNSSPPAAATPTFAPVAGSYSGTQSVTISSSTSACNSYIYWNTTGAPTISDTHSTSASVTTSETLYAKVIGCPNYSNSEVGSAEYTITAPAGIALGTGTNLGTWVQSEGSGMAQSITYAVSSASTRLFLVGCNNQADNPDPSVTPPTVSGGTLTWSLQASVRSFDQRVCAVWMATSAGAVASETVTVTWKGASYRFSALAVVAFTGTGSVGTPVTRSGQSGNNAYDVSVTTTATNSWVLAFGGAGSMTAGQTFTADTTILSYWPSDFWLGYNSAGSVATYSLGPTSGSWSQEIGIEVKP